MRNINFLKISIHITIILCISACGGETTSKSDVGLNDSIPTAMAAIVDRHNTIVAGALPREASYFLYNGTTMGFDFDMLKKFAKAHDYKIRLRINYELDSLLYMLSTGEIDLIASSQTVKLDMKDEYLFTERFYHSSLCLIQRKPENWKSLKIYQINSILTRNILDLEDYPIYVLKNGENHERIKLLSQDIGQKFNIIELDTTKHSFDLLDKVGQGEIDYTVADTEIASIYSAYNPNVDYYTEMSMPHPKAWILRKNSPQLHQQINTWLKDYQRYKEFYFIYDKYFNNPATIKKLQYNEEIKKGGPISKYDSIFKAEAKKINWDWRLLAAMAYQESHFKPGLVSSKGAVGLMQLLPTTAKWHGYTDLYNPEENIKAGVAHIKYTLKQFEDLDSINQVKFTLAAYNVGSGHIFDAQRLATLLGNSSTIWDGNVAEAILLKSDSSYYRLPEARNGYCKGIEPYNYVKNIIARYHNYKALLP